MDPLTNHASLIGAPSSCATAWLDRALENASCATSEPLIAYIASHTRLAAAPAPNNPRSSSRPTNSFQWLSGQLTDWRSLCAGSETATLSDLVAPGIAAPHRWQKRDSGGVCVPQCGQNTSPASGATRRPSAFQPSAPRWSAIPRRLLWFSVEHNEFAATLRCRQFRSAATTFSRSLGFSRATERFVEVIPGGLL